MTTSASAALRSSAGVAGLTTYDTARIADANIVSYWPLSESAGVYNDQKDSNPSASLVGTVTRAQGSILPTDPGGSVLLGGSGNITVADNANLDLGDGPFTLAVWIKPSGSFAGTPVFLSKQNNAYNFFISATGKLSLGKSGVSTQVAGATTLSAGTVYYVAASKSALGVCKVFINGVEDGSGSPGVALADNANALDIGSDIGTANRYSGNLQKLAIYNTNIAAATLLAHYGAG